MRNSHSLTRICLVYRPKYTVEMFFPIDVCGALQYAGSQVLFGILQMAVTVRVVADRGRFSWAID